MTEYEFQRNTLLDHTEIGKVRKNVGKISLSNWVKKIEVNENGDYITFDARDQGFLDRVMNLLKEFDAKKAECDEKIETIQGMPEDTKEQKIARASAALEFYSDVCGWIKEQINAVFQDDVSGKVFGDIKPTVEAWAEFLFQLTPIVQAAKAEQRERVRKYTKKYTG